MERGEAVREDLDWRVGAARVPVRVIRRAGDKTARPVLLLHGLGAGRETQDKEGTSLAGAGFIAVVVDAPHHGARRSTLLDEIAAARGAAAHELLLRMVREAAAEIPGLVERAAREFGEPVGAVGVSMGAYTALAGAAAEPRLAATVSILGSPDWTCPGEGTTAAIEAWAREAPVHRPERFPPRPLLMANGGLDVNVPPEAARAFAATLRPLYAAHPDRLVHAEYPLSPHLMREQDWSDLWRRTLDFMCRHLGRGG
ncbi:MAG: alpha/beta fold hydrolase [Deltaproteobacteria bacterium]|nr:alpha/beta fold hydrolase [Deltaproteobacteria bacterium]